MGPDDNGQAKQQTIVVGPVAAFIPMKMLGTNGGGFYGMNSAHPLENPTAATNFLTTFAMMLFPMALVLMYGRMLRRIRHSVVIFSVMLLMIGHIVWAIYFDTMEPNPGLTAHPERTFRSRAPARPAASTISFCPRWLVCRSISISAISKARNCASEPSAGATFAATPRCNLRRGKRRARQP